jgi:hypothetical protein
VKRLRCFDKSFLLSRAEPSQVSHDTARQTVCQCLQLTRRTVGGYSPGDASGDRNLMQMSWQETLVLAGVSLVLSAVVMGFVAFIADHILRG